MKITDKKIEELSHLARLNFNADDKEQIKVELEQILNFCEQLNQVNTDDVEPLIYMSDRTNHLRDDVVKPSLDKKLALKNAPNADSDYFRVSKVIKK